MAVMAKILAVDDIAENLTLLKDSLKSKYEVIAAKNGTKALELLQKNDLPDLILLDVGMPDIDGFEVCRRIKANPHTQDIPVIFLTILDQKHEILEGFHTGGVDYITKPFEPSILHARVATHLTLSMQKNSLKPIRIILNR
ncbi:MAG: response regulator [Campylobacterota bacterium]|nr:response regulator [Campylobacterota bacterium]